MVLPGNEFTIKICYIGMQPWYPTTLDNSIDRKADTANCIRKYCTFFSSVEHEYGILKNLEHSKEIPGKLTGLAERVVMMH